MPKTDIRILGGVLLALIGCASGLKLLEFALLGSVWWQFDSPSLLPLLFAHRLVATDSSARTNRLLMALAVLTASAYLATLWTVHMAAIMLFLWCLASLAVAGLRSAIHRRRALYAVALALLVPFAHQIAISGQHLTTLQVLTFDLAAYRIDAAIGFNPVAFFTGLDLSRLPWRVPLEGLVVVYATWAIPTGLLLIEQARRGGPDWIITVIAFFSAGLLGGLIYDYYPIAGPRFVFAGYLDGPAGGPLADPQQFALAAAPLSTEWARNGMPSLHVTWAFLAFLNACRLSRPMGWFCGGYFIATALSTIALGHHYLIDLIVALPFGLAVQAMARFDLPLRVPARRDALLLGVVLTAAWLLALRLAPDLLVASPVTMPLLTLLTVLAATVLSVRLTTAGNQIRMAAAGGLAPAVTAIRA